MRRNTRVKLAIGGETRSDPGIVGAPRHAGEEQVFPVENHSLIWMHAVSSFGHHSAKPA